MLLRQKELKGFTVQTSRNEFRNSIKNDDGQLRAKKAIYNKKSKKVKKKKKSNEKKTFWSLTFISCSASDQ